MKNTYSLAVALMLVLPMAQAAESPTTVTGATTIDGTQAKALFDKGVVFVDMRTDKDWGAGRIPGAVHLELSKAFTDAGLGAKVKKDQEVVMYCNGVSCLRSSEASAKAVGWGYKKVYYYRLGFPDWKSAGYPAE